jgi:hypothetical protein
MVFLRPTASAQYQYKTTTLYHFTSKTDGEQPGNALIFDQSGNLYGMTTYGGSGGCGGKGCGSIFKLSPNGSRGWTKTDRGPASVKAALRASRSRSQSLDTDLCASAYYSAIRGMSDF